MKFDNNISSAIAQSEDENLRQKAQLELDRKRMERNVKRANIFEKIGKFWTLSVFLLIVIIFGSIQPRVFSWPYWSSTLAYMTEIVILGLACGLVMIGGSVDLSVGSISGLVGVSAANLVKIFTPSLGMWGALIVSILIGLCIGAIVGTFNGFVVTRMKLSPFLATIGTQSICQGLSLVITGGVEVTGLPSIGSFANHKYFGFATPNMMISWLLVIIFAFLLNKTTFGIHTYALGSNKEALTRAGVDSDRHLTKLYTISGMLGAVSGLLLMMRFVSASPTTGQNTQLTAIAAAAIGGVSSTGGKGKAEGVLLGALIISVVMTGLVIVNVNTYWQQTAVGAIIIASVYMDRFSEKNIQR